MAISRASAAIPPRCSAANPGRTALELLFPGISEKQSDGSFKNYQGDINLFASRIRTERSGNIELMVPAAR